MLVDGYCDEVTLDILAQKRGGVDALVATGVFHDRFLILDGKELYHFGASLKDLSRKYCAVTKMDAMFIPSIMQRI